MKQYEALVKSFMKSLSTIELISMMLAPKLMQMALARYLKWGAHLTTRQDSQHFPPTGGTA